MLIVTMIVATGAGLHVAAYFIEHKALTGPVATVLTVALPVALYIGLNYAVYCYLVRRYYRFDLWLLSAAAAILVASVFAAQQGIGVAKCLMILVFVPAIIVVGHEGRGFRYQAAALRNN